MANPLFESLVGSLCEIKTENNNLLAVARVLSVDEEDDARLNLGPTQNDDRLPLINYETPVKVTSYSGKGGFVMLRGKVYISSDSYIALADLVTSQDHERRQYFRTNTNVPAEVEMQSGPKEGEAFDATVLDASLGGIRISCTRPLKSGDRVFASFTLLDRRMEFFCVVRREIPVPENPAGLRQFGCEFIDYTTRQIDQLCGEIFKLQRIELQRRKNR